MSLPSGWSRVPIENVADISSGVGFPKDRQGLRAGQFPFAKVSDITRAVVAANGFLSEATNYVNKEDLSSLRAKPIPAGSIVFAKIGEAIHLNRRARTTVPVVLDNNCMALTPRVGMVDPEFLYRFMTTVSLSPFAVATSVPSVRRTDVARIEIPLPPLAEQRRIVRKLDTVLERSKSARDNLARVPRLIERYKEATLAAAFRGALTVDWRQNQPRMAEGKQLLADLLASHQKSGKKKRAVEAFDPPEFLPELPYGWTWCPVDALASAVSDGVHKKPNYVEHGVLFLTVRNLTAGPGITFNGCRFVTQSDHEEFTKRTNPERGDLLISKDGTLGVVRAVRTDIPFSIFVSLALVKPIDRSMSDYLEFALSSPQVQQQMVGVGTGLQHIHLVDLRRDLIPIAPPEERVEIVKRINSAFAYIDRLECETIRATKLLERLDQATLAKAFRGELTGVN